ncbi:Por secretion system C-terminal sorting domain-containing protein [Pustulibacterium marinum]|uniref:Por secretion system C-terminal sorting domain-containing protein n=1 Tax=Pustulibacterium marinum TaxID=1224947 RepID=A0A1I7EZ31_9FLAO|nr:alpha-amylase family glycosyl hydrolase [Pustulibacterium marinum]SFU29149.1 Por secretion system C-terminal sorting domain-containing protein [Pustulibacterium marinum]
MKKIITLFICFITACGWAQITTSPNPPEADGAVTIYFDKSGTGLSSYTGTIYAHMGVTVDGNPWQNVIGSWGNNTTQPAFSVESGTTYSLTITPDLYTYFGVDSQSSITQISMVLRSADGNQQTSDIFVQVGGFQMTTISPTDGSLTTIASGSSLPISATVSSNANWSLEMNGSEISTASNTTSFSYNQTITTDASFTLTASEVGTSEEISVDFSAITTPSVTTEAIPDGIEQGITYDENDATKATLALYAPDKEYVHVIGSFNNWQISNSYLMKRDTEDADLYWMEIDGLTAGEVYTFQYRTSDGIKTADPYSTIVLSPYDDPYIEETTYPNMTVYPDGQEFEVSVIQTNQTAYEWQITDFERPEKEDLIIYELLIRDFNSEKTWASLIDDIDYFTGLNINAIEIMPVMEFEGNISWGYNTAYHLALDKAYGPENDMKEFIDLCHENGIAVILDVALNHVYGRSPLVRMWMDDPDGDGFGTPTADNPYCNQEAKHSYSVGYDLNHQSEVTQYYVERTINRWMNDFHIDGFRWDLTKGFTNNCTPSGETCTNNYQSDRVEILKDYADIQWDIDEDFYVIFEHLGVGGSATEETEWANYRADEGKGIMLWGNYNYNYNQNTMGYTDGSNFNGIDFEERGFDKPRLVGYGESHDEERLMYKNLEYGNVSGSYNVTDEDTSLDRMKTFGAVFFTIPGPKMFWQFGELGYDYNINYCQDGSTNNDCRTDPKPIPSEIGYDTDADRLEVYDAWAEMIHLRRTQEVFDTETFTVTSDQANLLPKIYIWNDDLGSDELNEVLVIANFKVTSFNVTPNFPSTGTWYNLLTDETLNVTSTGSDFVINLAPGEYRIYGNQQATMSTDVVAATEAIQLYPNPTSDTFQLSKSATHLQILDLQGKILLEKDNILPETVIDISNFKRGIYLVKIKDIDRIVINRLMKY